MTRLQFHLVSAVGVLLLALAPALLSPFSITLLNFIGIYALAVLGLVLLSGIGGMLSFGQAAFVGIAAYATAWLTVKEARRTDRFAQFAVAAAQLALDDAGDPGADR